MQTTYSNLSLLDNSDSKRRSIRDEFLGSWRRLSNQTGHLRQSHEQIHPHPFLQQLQHHQTLFFNLAKLPAKKRIDRWSGTKRRDRKRVLKYSRQPDFLDRQRTFRPVHREHGQVRHLALQTGHVHHRHNRQKVYDPGQQTLRAYR